MMNRRSRWGRLDTILLLLVLGVLAFFGYRVEAGLEYHWNWSVIPQYLLRFDDADGWTANLLLQGLLTTIRLSFWSLLFALPAAAGAGVDLLFFSQ